MAGKKSKKSATEAAEASKPKTVKVNGEELSLEESLDRAQIALEASQRHMLSLHGSWRSQLRRVGVIALFLVLKQSSIPSYDCLEKINEWNERVTKNNRETLLIGHWGVGKHCVTDSLMEIFSVLCCLSIIWLIYLPLEGDDFSSLPFRLAVFFVPLIVASYLQKPEIGCLKDLETEFGVELDGANSEKPRSFPVVLILLVVSFGSLYIMQYQQRQQIENLEKVEKLREDLLEKKK